MQPTWDGLVCETDAAVAALQTIYARCRNSVAELKAGRGSPAELERLLNQTLPVTEVDRRLAFFISFLARDKRSPLFEFLFKTQRACLLLLADAAAASVALNLESTEYQISTDADTGEFRVGPRVRTERRRNRGHGRGGNGGRGGDGGHDRGERRDGGERRAANPKPTMNYHAVLADLSADAATAQPALTYSNVARGLTRPSAPPPVSTVGEAPPAAAVTAPAATKTAVTDSATSAESTTAPPPTEGSIAEVMSAFAENKKSVGNWSDATDDDDPPATQSSAN